MSQPDSVTSCGDCFESWTAPADMPMKVPLSEVEIHTESTGHRYDVQTQDAE